MSKNASERNYDQEDLKLLDSIIQLKKENKGSDFEIRVQPNGGYKIVVATKKVITIS